MRGVGWFTILHVHAVYFNCIKTCDKTVQSRQRKPDHASRFTEISPRSRELHKLELNQPPDHVQRGFALANGARRAPRAFAHRSV
jgi:hypothetical protein